MFTEKEIYAHKSKSLLFLQIVGYVLCILVSSVLFNSLRIATGWAWLSLFPYAVAVFIFWYTYRTQIIKYNYNLNEHRVTITRQRWQKELVLANISLSRIVSIEPLPKGYWGDKAARKNDGVALYALRASQRQMLLTYRDKKITRQLIFSPSEEFMRRLNRYLEERK